MHVTDSNAICAWKQGTRNVQGIILELRKKQLVEDDRSVRTIFHNNFLSALNLTSVFEYLKEKCAYLLRLPKEEKEGEIILNTNSFESMVNLRLLQINGVKLEGKFEHFPRELKWLQWKKCPFRNLPSDYRPSQLAILDLSESGIDRVCGWRNNMVRFHFFKSSRFLGFVLVNILNIDVKELASVLKAKNFLCCRWLRS